jgi:hypothetical protein
MVVLVGIEPTTSSMPWRLRTCRPLILKGLMAGGMDEVVEAHRILASAYFTHSEYKRALAQVDAILALKEK